MAEPKQEEMLQSIDYKASGWMAPSAPFRKGTYSYGAPVKHQKYLELPNIREWQPTDADWKLPENWKEIVLSGMKKLLARHRSFRLYLDICVRCGACADKCHYYIGSGDPKNMPVIRAELLRSVYRRYFTTGGPPFRPPGRRARAYRGRDQGVVLLFLPVLGVPPLLRLLPLRHRYLRDHDDGRELLNLLGINIQWVVEPASNCFRTGNHLGIPPHAMKETLEFRRRRAGRHHGHQSGPPHK